MFVVPLVAGLVGLLFGAALLRQYLNRRQPSQLIWAFALALFGCAALLEAAGILAGWNDGLYKAYYLLGGILNVGWLAVGELYLLARGRMAALSAVIMGVVSVAAMVAVATSHTDPVLLQQDIPGRGAISSPAAPVFPLVTNVAGTVILVGGAAWSAWTGYRRAAPWTRVAGTALIAAGAFIVAGSHSAAQARGLYAVQPVGEATGIVVMFLGYLVVEAQPYRAARPSSA